MLNAITSWLSRQSLSRLVGILLGNTRELEYLLAEKRAEVERLSQGHEGELTRRQIEEHRLKDEIAWWKLQYTAVLDSWLLSRGNRPTDPAALAVPRNGSPDKPAVIVEKFAVDVEADAIVEMLYYQPQEFVLKVEDLEKSSRPRDKEVLRRVKQKINATPEDSPSDGVVIGPAAIS